MKACVIPTISIFLLVSGSAHARFNQQNPPVQQQINAFGGDLATLSGQIPNSLLATSDPCLQGKLADQIFQAGVNQTNVLKLVQEFMNAERNFNPFAGAKAHPAFCNDPTVPRTKELRGILPLIDPAAGNNGGKTADDINKISKQLLQEAQSGKDLSAIAAGKSIQQQIEALGFTDCIGCSGQGGAGSPNNSSSSGNSRGNSTTQAQSSGVQILTGSLQNNQTANQNVIAGNSTANSKSRSGKNIQTFKGALFGKAVDPVIFTAGAQRPFNVAGNTFIQAAGALQRSCDIQFNQCADVVNERKGPAGASVSQCNQQKDQCNAAISGIVSSLPKQ